MDWIIENKEWIFSGIGVFILGIIINILRKKSNKTTQRQKSGNNSTNIQIGGNVEINKKD